MPDFTIPQVDYWFSNPGNISGLVSYSQQCLYRTVFPHNSSHIEGRDVVNDTYIRAVTNIMNSDADSIPETESTSGSSDDKEPKLKIWLFKIARNLVKDRARRLNGKTFIQIAEDFELEEGRYAPASISYCPTIPSYDSLDIDRKRAIKIIKDACEDIGKKGGYLRLSIDGLLYREIADEYHTSLGSVKSGLHNAKKEIVARLNEEGIGLDDIVG